MLSIISARNGSQPGGRLASRDDVVARTRAQPRRIGVQKLRSGLDERHPGSQGATRAGLAGGRLCRLPTAHQQRDIDPSLQRAAAVDDAMAEIPVAKRYMPWRGRPAMVGAGEAVMHPMTSGLQTLRLHRPFAGLALNQQHFECFPHAPMVGLPTDADQGHSSVRDGPMVTSRTGRGHQRAAGFVRPSRSSGHDLVLAPGEGMYEAGDAGKEQDQGDAEANQRSLMGPLTEDAESV
jgi:hypothetical protein